MSELRPASPSDILAPRIHEPLGSSGIARTGQEVVADEHAEQHEVVDNPLQVELERQCAGGGLELQLQVIPQQPNLEQDEMLGARVL